jgi:hypothetical protein
VTADPARRRPHLVAGGQVGGIGHHIDRPRPRANDRGDPEPGAPGPNRPTPPRQNPPPRRPSQSPDSAATAASEPSNRHGPHRFRNRSAAGYLRHNGAAVHCSLGATGPRPDWRPAGPLHEETCSAVSSRRAWIGSKVWRLHPDLGIAEDRCMILPAPRGVSVPLALSSYDTGPPAAMVARTLSPTFHRRDRAQRLRPRRAPRSLPTAPAGRRGRP